MRRVALFSLLLIVGLVGSQVLPILLRESFTIMSEVVSALTLVALAFIMIHVGYEFEIDKTRARAYGWDYIVAMTAAAFPWALVAFYFVWAMLPPDLRGEWRAWKEVLIVSRFAAPTSAGILFSMLAAAGLSATWVFRKARILAIFDDLDTVLLMIPLTMMIIGPAWQLGVVVVVMFLMLWLAWRFLHRCRIPVSWPWVLAYAVAIVGVTEGFYHLTKKLSEIPIHIEVLLPAFVLGCLMMRPGGADPHRDDLRPGHQEGPEVPGEQRVATILAGAFMLLVGLSMPPVWGPVESAKPVLGATLTGQLSMPGPATIALHVLLITILSNLGKMYPALVYKKEAHWKERLAVAVGMWPRGEVGAGVVVISLGYGIGGPMVTVAVLSLALNLALTGVFIWIVKRLLRNAPSAHGATA